MSRPASLLATGLAVLVLLSVGVAGCGGDAAAPEEPALTVVTFNVCGVVCAEGRNDALPFLEELLVSTPDSVVALQEVCRSQADAVADSVGATVHYTSSVTGDFNGLNRCPGDDLGIALLSTLEVAQAFTVELPNPGLGTAYLDERSVPCITVKAQMTVTVCTTHVVRRGTDPASHDAQIAALPAVLTRLNRERGAVVLAGDLNSDLDVLDDLPRMVRDDLSGVDHVLASTPPFDRVHTRRHRCSCSDHRAVVANVTAE